MAWILGGAGLLGISVYFWNSEGILGLVANPLPFGVGKLRAESERGLPKVTWELVTD